MLNILPEISTIYLARSAKVAERAIYLKAAAVTSLCIDGCLLSQLKTIRFLARDCNIYISRL